MPNQVLSAAVDSAATEAEWDALIAAVGDDPDIKDDWSRIWAARDAREGVSVSASSDFCLQVMAAIANEKPLPSNVVAMPSRLARPAIKKSALSWRTLVPLSAAAGIVAAVLMVGGLRNVTTVNTAEQTAAASATTVAERNELPDEAKAAILNAYLMEHSNSLAERSMGGTLANARFAARTANYRPDAP